MERKTKTVTLLVCDEAVLLAAFHLLCDVIFFTFVFSWQTWDVFQEITEIFILVPAVLGMKGNLEMTLASRLSTAVSICIIAHTSQQSKSSHMQQSCSSSV